MRAVLVATLALLLLAPAAHGQPDGTQDVVLDLSMLQGTVSAAFNDTIYARVRFRGQIEAAGYLDSNFVQGTGTLRYSRERVILEFEELRLLGDEIGALSARRPGTVTSPVDVRGLDEVMRSLGVASRSKPW